MIILPNSPGEIYLMFLAYPSLKSGNGFRKARFTMGFDPPSPFMAVRFKESNCPIDGWDLRFYAHFNIISPISGRWADDNEWLCAMVDG